jgi:hypothetical protein
MCDFSFIQKWFSNSIFSCFSNISSVVIPKLAFFVHFYIHKIHYLRKQLKPKFNLIGENNSLNKIFELLTDIFIFIFMVISQLGSYLLLAIMIH